LIKKLADVVLTNKISFNDQTVVTFAGLEKGQEHEQIMLLRTEPLMKLELRKQN
jgi:hypothetical protein